MLTGIRTKTRFTEERGLTLLEIIVVLAVVGLLAAALMPMVLGYLEDAKKSKAEGEVRVIAAALANLTKDLRHFPAYTGTTNTGKADLELLCSAGSLPDLAPGVTGWPEFAATTDCKEAGGKVDTLENILIKNTPLGDGTPFNTTDRSKGQWRGPYGDRFVADPWERAYVVNIKNGEVFTGDPAFPESLKKVIWVLSAGPNGVIDTRADSKSTEGELFPGGDDIAIRIK